MMKKYELEGFSLVEMAVVLVILGLLLGGLLMPLTAQLDLKNYSETKRLLEDAKEALYGYAMSHAAIDGRPYLPCPDVNNDGLEEARVVNVCPSQEGRLPWNTLGLTRSDSWGNLLRYRVRPNFSNSANGFTLNSPATMRICQDNACATIISSNIPAVLVSHGKNGYGTYNAESGTVIQVPAGLSANELENMDGRDNPRAGNNIADTVDTGDVDFVSTFTSAGYDDVVVWISPNVLFNRMVNAGRLP
ncbi:MAG: prepilin-type N-terminal cleavage/methylation domain-containing protein [Methylotenera sp.]